IQYIVGHVNVSHIINKFTIYSIIIFSYQLGLSEIYVNSFSYLRIPMPGIASMAFAYYLRHTHMFYLSDRISQLAMSLSYGLSSYILAQESNILILLAYSLFPILFLTYEWMTSDKKHIPFVISNAIILLICPIVGIPVTILLYLLSFFELSLHKRFHFGDLLHITGNFLLSILTGSFGIVFFLAPYYADHETYAYEGFQIIHNITFFLSRFLPGNMPAQQFFFTTNKIDLYFGLTAMTFAVLFFFQSDIALRKRVYYAFFTLILVASLQLSPLQFILNLFITTEKETIVFSFFLIFWALRLACESFSKATYTCKLPIIITACIIILIGGISWCFEQHNFLRWMLIVHIILWSIILISLLHIRTKNIFIFRKFIFCLILLELCFNTAIITNSKARPKTASTHAALFYQHDKKNSTANDKNTAHNQKPSEANSSKTTEKTLNTSENSTRTQRQEEPSFHLTTQEYKDYVTTHTNKTTDKVLANLIASTWIEKDSKEYKNFILSDSFQRTNTLCHQLGIKGNLFTPCNVTLDFPKNPEYTITNLGHQIYHIACPATEKVSYGFIPYSLYLNQNTEDPIYLFDNISGNMLELDDQLLSGKHYAYQPTGAEQNTSISISCQILCYSMNMNVFHQLSALLQKTDSDQAEKSQPSYLTYDIIGTVCSYLGCMILLVLLFYNEKEQIYRHLYQVRISMTNAKMIQMISQHLKRNKVYYFSFLLPAIMFLCIYIYTDCMPFGPNSIIDEDGFTLELTEILDYH
ncbi:MAG: YfhO family protein, partial [Lachnospiraceae bacterium]|nr:YfhO family protein [Lachnospiraceae bacterium]